MKKVILNKIREEIKKQYPKYSNDKLDEIMYGVEGLYLTLTKTIIIFLISLLLGCTKELIYLLLSFNFIRLFSFGMHADKSSTCLIFSSTLFIGGAFLINSLIIPKYILYILYFIILIIMCLYAPADTVKRPLINKKKRMRFKILSILVTIIYFILTILIDNNIFTNSLLIGLLISCILILPITYKAFKMPYRNYINYGLNTI